MAKKIEIKRATRDATGFWVLYVNGKRETYRKRRKNLKKYAKRYIR